MTQTTTQTTTQSHGHTDIWRKLSHAVTSMRTYNTNCHTSSQAHTYMTQLPHKVTSTRIYDTNYHTQSHAHTHIWHKLPHAVTCTRAYSINYHTQSQAHAYMTNCHTKLHARTHMQANGWGWYEWASNTHMLRNVCSLKGSVWDMTFCTTNLYPYKSSRSLEIQASQNIWVSNKLINTVSLSSYLIRRRFQLYVLIMKLN